MQAAVLTALNAPLEVADVGLTDLQFGQVLVRVQASGVCGAQLQEIAGHKGNAKFLPHLMGHEGCGIVEAVGVGVSRVRVGDKIVMHWRKAAGIESPAPEYVFNGRRITSGRVTTFSEYSICSENRLTPVPLDTPRELCALLGCGLSTALATIERDAGVRFGERVMVVGLGGLGVNLVRAAKLAHASRIVCVDVRETKRAVATAAGADFIPADALCGHECCRANVVIDTAGTRESIAAASRHLAPSGRYVLVGQPKPGEDVTLPNAAHFFEGNGKSFRATQGGGFRPDEDIPRYVDLFRTGALKLDGIITHRFGLDHINDAIATVRAGEASRVLIEM